MTSQKIAASPILECASNITEHDKTYRGFLTFVKISAVVVICWVLSLGLGGLKEAWGVAVFGVVASAIAGAVGALRPSVGVIAPGVAAFALALLLLFK